MVLGLGLRVRSYKMNRLQKRNYKKLQAIVAIAYPKDSNAKMTGI